MKKIQLVGIILFAIACVILASIYKLFVFRTFPIDSKIAIMLMPVIASLLFSVFVYYPLSRFLVQKNIKDGEKIDTLLDCMFECAFRDAAGSKAGLETLKKLMDTEKSFLDEYGLSIYLKEYSNQAKFSTITNKPSENVIHYVIDRCNQIKCEINSITPDPFPGIGIILSFVFSTILTVLLTAVSVLGNPV